MLIDTHAHVNFTAFKEEYTDVVARAVQASVSIVCVGTHLDTSREAVRMAQEFQISNFKFQIYAVVGLHPVHTYSQHVDEEESHFTTREETFDYQAYKQLADNPLVVGIGECGLDYYRLPEGKSLESGIQNVEQIKQMQKDAFIAQIRLAKELDKALVIHCRPSAGTVDAYEDILQILDKEFENFKFQISNFRFEIHSFTGTPEIAKEFLNRGAYVGVNGIITFDKTGNMEQVIKTVPLERIVLETDSPYLTPKPYRGKKNEPAYVTYVAQKVAEIKEISVDEVAVQTTANAKSLFGI